MNKSLWLDTIALPQYPILTNNIEADICIVGAGITGITLAYVLRDAGLKIALIDSDQLLHGTTAYSTAKLTAQHHVIYHDLIEDYGKCNAKRYANAQIAAVEFIKRTNIECDLEHLTSYVYTEQKAHVQTLEKELEAAKQLGFDCELVSNLKLPFKVEKALAFHNQAQFNPLKYLTGLLKELEEYSNIVIYEQTAATSLKRLEDGGYQIETNKNHHITVKKVIQSCHFPFYDGGSLLFAKIEARTSYLMATNQPTNDLAGMYISYEKPATTLRKYKDFLIVGGGDHRTGTAKNSLQKLDIIRNFVHDQFQISDIQYHWSTQDYLTPDKLPFIGELNAADIYVATGYQKWGMTNGVAAALLLHDLVLGIENPWAELVNPHRFNLKAQFKDLVTYNSRVVAELVKGKLRVGELFVDIDADMEIGQAKVIETLAGTYGVYKDLDGDAHVLDITCTHLGCELRFNQSEATWDCPCHGSRFSYKGEIISGPAHRTLRRDKNKIDPNLTTSSPIRKLN